MQLRYAPIVEVLCEIRFVTADRRALPADAGSQLHELLRHRYPHLSFLTDNHINVQYQVDSGQVQTNMATPGKRLVFKSANSRDLLQLTDGVLTVNALAPYDGWSGFAAKVERAWADAQAALGLRLGPRLTLRYINRIVRDGTTATVGNWLVDGPFVPPAILSAQEAFQFAMQVRDPASGLHTGVTLGTFQMPPGESPEPAPLLLDIAVFDDLTLTLPTKGLSALLPRMHDRVQAVFSNTVSAAALRRWR